ncbi:hypothetical protein TUM4438_40140 [Shewanella sairae]|uniref:N6 adenine-specific DNA methyltransferase N-terminal domain-containing protein n=1 Tax=Shewanella sairae TaxID=190310 RepID=A0ABQ4PQ88_9GAMM|nr:type I restriction-modification system subunit M N-terminal domain-containing protein [Shewanella sairae]MCL1132147.1 type I restriction-modification system subunit M N-terminal domain-containing protein [Shewanella sairae]GIU51232.1 hypothetical protein TUM4438_40140 [Shewanella sairae]
MNKKEQVNKTVWAACDTFRGTVDPSIYKDFIMTMMSSDNQISIPPDHANFVSIRHNWFVERCAF